MTTRRGFLALLGGAALAACVPDTKRLKPGKFPPETYPRKSITLEELDKQIRLHGIYHITPVDSQFVKMMSGRA